MHTPMTDTTRTFYSDFERAYNAARRRRFTEAMASLLEDEDHPLAGDRINVYCRGEFFALLPEATEEDALEAARQISVDRRALAYVLTPRWAVYGPHAEVTRLPEVFSPSAAR